jgi:hypothetical protein
MGAAQKARRGRIAEAIVMGKTVTQIAEKEKISRGWASVEAHSDETRLLIAEMLDRRKARMSILLDRTIDMIEKSYEADKTVVIDGDICNAGPDHFARIAGGKLYVALVNAGRATPKTEDKANKFEGVTLQQLDAAVAAHEAGQ